MKKIAALFLVLIPVFAFLKAHAQLSYSNIDVTYMSNGEFKAGHNNNHYMGIDGHPYMYDYWFPGWAKLSDGKQYNNLIMLYDEVTGLPNFKNSPKDSVMTFSPRATEFGFVALSADGTQHAVSFKSGFAKADGLNENTYYQVLAAGKMTLLKRTAKTIAKHTTYGTNQVTTSLETNEVYYLATDNKPAKIKNNNKSVLTAMSDKETQIKTFIESKSLNVKNDSDFIEVVKYYNTL